MNFNVGTAGDQEPKHLDLKGRLSHDIVDSLPEPRLKHYQSYVDERKSLAFGTTPHDEIGAKRDAKTLKRYADIFCALQGN